MKKRFRGSRFRGSKVEEKREPDRIYMSVVAAEPAPYLIRGLAPALVLFLKLGHWTFLACPACPVR